MPRYLISFPTGVMDVPDDEFEAVRVAAYAVIVEAKAAGVYVFGGGIDEEVMPVAVAADGSVRAPVYPQFADLWGGHTIVDVPTQEEAVAWAARIAAACRCPQEVRRFMPDPEF